MAEETSNAPRAEKKSRQNAPAARAPEEQPMDAAHDEVESRLAPWWDAGGRTLSWIYWTGIAIFVVALFRTRSLPFVDYPQHLSLAATLRRMLSSAPDQALFETNLASYNSLFHVVVAGLAVVFPIDVAGKLALSGYFVLVAAGALALLRATGRPRSRAFLVLTVLVGYSIVWGFVNFGLGFSIQLFTLARLLGRPDGMTGRTRWRYDALTAFVAVLGAYAHLLASALAYMLMLVVLVAEVQTDDAPLVPRLRRAFDRGAPLLVAVLYSAAVYVHQQHASYQNFEYGASEGNDNFALVKVKGFLDYACGLRADHLDSKVLGVAIWALVAGAVLRDRRDKRHPALAWMFVASVFAYLVIPHVFWATNFVYERISFLVVITAILWTPRAMPAVEPWLRIAYVSIGCAAVGNFFSAMGAASDELADMDAAIDDAPPGRRIVGLINYPKTEAFAQWELVHVASYYVARRGGEEAFSFKRTMSLPVHYRKETMPPDPPPNFEWRPYDYTPDAPFARYFDLVLYKANSISDPDPRAKLFDEDAKRVSIVSHHGAWWVLDTKPIR
jgi:hypothetical protein